MRPFIKQTLSDIICAIREAQEEVKDSGVVLAPWGSLVYGDPDQRIKAGTSHVQLTNPP